jgi:hypothetical protein
MGQGASLPPRQWPQPLRSHPPAVQWPSQGCGSAPQPAHRYGKPLPLEERGFNAGVFVFNLARWRAMNLTAEAEWWIRANTAEKLYLLGSQPPLTLAILGGAGRCQELPDSWHLSCLGCMGKGRLKSKEELAAAHLLHWNGPNKPFGTNGRRAHQELFRPYAGRGEACTASGKESSGRDD